MDAHRYDDIRKVLIVRTIVESGSVQKAARELKVSPSAISQSLSSLEKKLGYALFRREPGRLTPTPACLSLLERARPALAALDSLFIDAKPKLRIASLDLGAYESLAHMVLPRFVRKIRAAHEGVKLNITVSRTADLLKRLRSGELCTALVVETDGMDRVRTEEIARDRLGIYVASSLASRAGDWSAVEALGFGFLSVAADGIPLYLKKFCKQLGPRPPVTMTSDSFEVLRRAAASGLLAALLPRRVAERGMADLVEVTQFRGKERTELGEHRVLLATQDRCDEEEAEYLAALARSCFQEEATGAKAGLADYPLET